MFVMLKSYERWILIMMNIWGALGKHLSTVIVNRRLHYVMVMKHRMTK